MMELTDRKPGQGKYKIRQDNGFVDFYRFYRKRSKKPVDYTTFSKIHKAYWNGRMEEMIENDNPIWLKHGLGDLDVVKTDGKPQLNEDGTLNDSKKVVDWAKTRAWWQEKYGDDWRNVKGKKTLRLNNEHSNGMIFSFRWDNSTARSRNCKIYEFKATKQKRSFLAAIIRGGNHDFKNIENA